MEVTVLPTQPSLSFVDYQKPHPSHDWIAAVVDWAMNWIAQCTPVEPSEYDGFIYVWVNNVNGHCYVGKTKNFERRTKDHFHPSNGCCAFRNAIAKYGSAAFTPIVRTCPANLMTPVEMGLISFLRRAGIFLYNLTAGGDGFVDMSPESRAKLGAALRKHYQNPEARAKRSEIVRRVFQDPAIRQKLRESVKRARSTPEQRAVSHRVMSRRWADPIEAERLKSGMRAAWEREGYRDDIRGENNRSAKLTAAKVNEIRTRYVAGGVTLKELAAEYGVAFCNINKIVKNLTWKDPDFTPLKPYRNMFGENSKAAKLTASKVSLIRSRYAAGGISSHDLSSEYGVEASTITAVIRREIWKDIP